MTAPPRIGVLGGTLDPIHFGHLDAAAAARKALELDQILVLPSRVPPHRAARPAASAYHRFAMAALAVNGEANAVVSDLELCAPDGPSYTSDTLSRLSAGMGLSRTQMFFITGADAFAEIATWHRYPDVLDLAHFVVVSRPGFPVGELRDRLPDIAARMSPASAWRAREASPAIFLVDARTRGVSSTDIRRRLAAGEPVAGLIPAPVESHIRRHGLYAPVSFLSAADHLHGEN